MFESFNYKRNLKFIIKDLEKMKNTKSEKKLYKIQNKLEKRIEKCLSLVDRAFPFQDDKIKKEKRILSLYPKLAPLLVKLKLGEISGREYKIESEKLFVDLIY